jgi:hypothetical protein
MFLSRSSPYLRAAGAGLTGLAGVFGEAAWLHMHAVGGRSAPSAVPRPIRIARSVP